MRIRAKSQLDPPGDVRSSVEPVGAPTLPTQDGVPALPQRQTEPADLILHERYRELTRRHLERLPALFTKLTGLHSHVAWAPRLPRGWSVRNLPTHSRLCRKLVAGRPKALARCRHCAQQHLRLALNSGHNGQHFTCHFGVHNFWLPIIVRGYVVGLAFVQALAQPAQQATPQRTDHSTDPGPTKSPRPTADAQSSSSLFPPIPFRNAAGRVNRSDFREAAKLLHLVFAHAETSALADLRAADLTQAQRALAELQTVATRLRRELNGLAPAFNKTAPLLEVENHASRVVHAALEYIHQHYTKPLTLRQCARELRLNASYLSAQFSITVGIPFKTYLTEVRMEKARELLSNPAAAIADVSSSVGYASENRFRLAFKQATGLCPRLWRETLRMDPREGT